MTRQQSAQPIDNQRHFDQLVTWLNMESRAELDRIARRRQRISAEAAEKSGESLLDLVISEQSLGLGGRRLLTFVKRNRTLRLPWNRLKVGTPVTISCHDDPHTPSTHGVVSRRDAQAIQIATEDWPEAEQLRIDLAADEVTRRRQQSALASVRQSGGRLGQLRDVLLMHRPPRFREVGEMASRAGLNESQCRAVRLALQAEDLAIIHGPPGTGKTTTVVELIRQAVVGGEKVLACAPSNTAVDHLLEKLVGAGVNAVRLGHPARVTQSMRDHCLDMLVQRHENMTIVRQMQREADTLFRQIDRYTRSKPPPGARQQMRRDAARLRSDARLLERQAVEHLLDRADVLCATMTLEPELLGDRTMDLVVIDEACQATEAACWVPLLYAQRVVLAGDHCQLPPTVISQQAAREGFDLSLLERLVTGYSDQVTRRLDIQYRMHRDIMQFSSDQFYSGTLQADPSVAEHLLVDLPQVVDSDLTQNPVTFIDTAGAGWDEEIEPDGESRLNPTEAKLILRKLTELCQAGIDPGDVAVIAPYAAQVRWLRQQNSQPDVEIDTVDGFQGREKEAVLITLVRSNRDREIGFLADTRRMNVALTRARRKLIVVGDSSTLGGHEFYDQLLATFEQLGAYHTVWEEELTDL